MDTLLEKHIAAARILYTPLYSWQIRVLDLHQAESGYAPLTATLYVSHFTHKRAVVIEKTKEWVEYAALSYTWGAPEFSCSIQINGIEFPITKNLHAFLLEYRKPSRQKRMIWIDAICINQHDNAEKSVQVAGMVDVFMNATLTIVWLGPGTLETDRAVEFLEENVIGDIFDRPQGLDGSDVFEGKKITYLENGGTFDRPRRLDTFDVLKGEDITVLEAGLLDLASRPWYWRVWIRQEIWASESIVVSCGEKEISWSRLTEIAKLDLAWKDGRGPGVLRSLGPASVKELHGSQATNHRKTLVALLREAALCESSDPRDRIFALLSMSGDQLIKPDYHLDLVDVLCKLAPVICSSDLGCSFLEYRRWSCPSARPEGLPSWCSDWRHVFSSSYTIPFQRTKWYREGLFDMTANDEMYPRSTDARKWRLYGFVIGRLGKELSSLTGDVYLWKEKTWAATQPRTPPQNFEETMSRIKELCRSVVPIEPPAISDHVLLHVHKDQPLNGVFLQRRKASFGRGDTNRNSQWYVSPDTEIPSQRLQPLDPNVKHMNLICNPDLFAVDEMRNCATSISKADASIGIINSADMIIKRLDRLLSAARGPDHYDPPDEIPGEPVFITRPSPTRVSHGSVIYGETPIDFDFNGPWAVQGLGSVHGPKLLTNPFPRELAVSADGVQENDLVVKCLEQDSLVVLRPVAGQKQFEFVGMASLNSQWMYEMAKRDSGFRTDLCLLNGAYTAHRLWWDNMSCVLEERRDAGMLDMFELV